MSLAALAAATYLVIVAVPAAFIIRCWRRECRLAAREARAKARARLPEEMFLLRRDPDDLGPDHAWVDKLLADIDQLPTTTHERGNQ